MREKGADVVNGRRRMVCYAGGDIGLQGVNIIRW
jgi:hypothetical protein